MFYYVVVHYGDYRKPLVLYTFQQSGIASVNKMFRTDQKGKSLVIEMAVQRTRCVNVNFVLAESGCSGAKVALAEKLEVK